jgi:ketosteroid isomerase-like protein
VGIVLLAAGMAFGAAPDRNAELKEQVRKAESAFAKSMADRDHAAFVSHLAEDALFFGGKGVQRGKAAVAAAWKPLFEKPDAPFSWRPEEVEVLDSGTLAMTSGPVFDPAGKRFGTFNSVWRKDAGGSWRIVLDKGCDCPAP